MDAQTLMDTLRRMLAADDAAMAALRADKPNVTDGHSDGKRVRYVRHETRAALMAEVIQLLEGNDR